MRTIIFKMLVLLSAILIAASCNSRDDRTDAYNNSDNQQNGSGQAGNASSVRNDTITGGGTVYQGGNSDAGNSRSQNQPGESRDRNNKPNDQNSTANNQNNATMNIATADRNFAMEAYKGGRMEVKMANMAMERGQNIRVKNFAQMMVRDHTKANNELETILSRQNLMSEAERTENDNHMQNMNNKTGRDFDVDYMRMMVNDHNKDIELFRKESTEGQNDELKAFAARTLPTLRIHLDSAKAIYGSLSGAASTRH